MKDELMVNIMNTDSVSYGRRPCLRWKQIMLTMETDNGNYGNR